VYPWPVKMSNILHLACATLQNGRTSSAPTRRGRRRAGTCHNTATNSSAPHPVRAHSCKRNWISVSVGMAVDRSIQTRGRWGITVTRKFAFLLATAGALSVAPQIAHASCTGSACSSFSVENKSYSSSEKRAKAVFINKDKSRGIRLKGCVMEAGKCGRTFVLEIDPGLKSTVSEPATNQSAVLDINTADFLPQQGSGSSVKDTPQQCQRRCMGNDTPTERADCLKTCPQANVPLPKDKKHAMSVRAASIRTPADRVATRSRARSDLLAHKFS